jgi:hypothetical protein
MKIRGNFWFLKNKRFLERVTGNDQTRDFISQMLDIGSWISLPIGFTIQNSVHFPAHIASLLFLPTCTPTPITEAPLIKTENFETMLCNGLPMVIENNGWK